MSFIIDVIEEKKNVTALWDYTYVFFPQLVAGPIERKIYYLKSSTRRNLHEQSLDGFYLFSCGFAERQLGI